MGKQKYTSDIILGEKYEDIQTGLEGTATAIYFYQYGCERVSIETFDEKTQEVRTHTFDAPRLRNIKTQKVATVERTGGPGNGHEARRDAGAMR